MRPEPPASEHLESEEVAAYLDQALSPPDRVRVEAHLAECEECRSEVVEVSRLLAPPARKPRWSMLAPAAGLAAAAVIAGVLLIRAPDASSPGDNTRVRTAALETEAEGVRRLRILSPREGEVVQASALTFAWNPLGADVAYRLTVVDESGAEVWTGETGENRLSPPEEIAAGRLKPGEAYYWRVDAVGPGLTDATTGEHRFTIAAQ